MNTTPTKAALHQIIDALPETALADALRSLAELLEDPELRLAFTAPEDDETETDEERNLVQEARAALATGRVRTGAELDALFGGPPDAG